MIVRDARAEDAPALARVEVDTWRATYRGIHPDAVLDALSSKEATARWGQILATQAARGQFTLVAEDDAGAVVGYASGGPRLGPHEPPYDAYAGELGRLYVHPSEQGRGIGRALVRAMAERLARAGHRSLLVKVAAANRSGRGFYEAIGGRLLGYRRETLRGLTSDHAIYGWPDTAPLLAPDRLRPDG